MLALSVEILCISNSVVEEAALKNDPIIPAEVAFPICDQRTQTMPETWRYDQVQMIGHQKQESEVPFLECLIVPSRV